MSNASHDFPIFGAPTKINKPIEIIPSMQNSIGFSGAVINYLQFTVFSSSNVWCSKRPYHSKIYNS